VIFVHRRLRVMTKRIDEAAMIYMPSGWEEEDGMGKWVRMRPGDEHVIQWDYMLFT
jgi:hypothetical protein